MDMASFLQGGTSLRKIAAPFQQYSGPPPAAQPRVNPTVTNGPNFTFNGSLPLTHGGLPDISGPPFIPRVNLPQNIAAPQWNLYSNATNRWFENNNNGQRLNIAQPFIDTPTNIPHSNLMMTLPVQYQTPQPRKPIVNYF